MRARTKELGLAGLGALSFVGAVQAHGQANVAAALANIDEEDAAKKRALALAVASGLLFFLSIKAR